MRELKIYSMRVANQRVDPIPEDAIYVGRAMPRQRLKGSKFSNPYALRGEWDRATALNYFWRHILEQLRTDPTFVDELRGHDLVCWCQSPSMGGYACHALILLYLGNEPRCTRCGVSVRPAELDLDQHCCRRCVRREGTTA